MQKHTTVALVQTSLIVLILLWFTSVMVDCDNFLSRECDKAIWASWLDLWRLGWVKNYKELVAGLIAAAAAALVLVSTKLQLSANSERYNADQRASNVAIFTVLAHKFGTAHAAIVTLSVTPAEENIFADIKYSDDFIAKYGTYYGLAEITKLNGIRAIAAVIQAETNLLIYRRFSDLTKTTKARAARLRACMEIFNDMAKVANAGGYLGTKPIASARLMETLLAAGMKPEELGRTHNFLSWPPKSGDITVEIEEPED